MLRRHVTSPGNRAPSRRIQSTTDEVLEGCDLGGKRVLVTGVSAGLGVETARTLAAHGAQVVGAQALPWTQGTNP
jgi:trans-2-enoyl-CoA reductase